MIVKQNPFVRSEWCGANRKAACFWATAIIAVAFALEAAGQATVTFQNAGAGYLWPIYLPETSDPYLEKHGNTSAGLPAGTQTYSGGLVSGTGYSAQLWAGPAGTGEEALTPVALTTFRTGSLAGRVVPVTATVPGVTPGASFIWQARAWDNRTNTVTSWAQVLADPAVARGKSFLVTALSTIPPAMPAVTSGGESFNLFLDWAPRVSWFTVDGGGGFNSTGGGFSVSGTIGQPDAGTTSGGNYSVNGGFWSLFAVQTSGAPLLSIEQLANGSARVFWPLPATGFVLDQTMALSNAPAATVWSQVGFPYQTNATHISITVPMPTGTKYYRLRK